MLELAQTHAFRVAWMPPKTVGPIVVHTYSGASENKRCGKLMRLKYRNEKMSVLPQLHMEER